MYLKRIYAYGFKSFADKVDIEIKSGVTGVVGPNGSGKSNIVDAIRWVLGEQSIKALRGSDTMTDVIFNGSKSRKPATRATVALTIDNSDRYLNSDFKEIEIKRILYRNGDNEYYINNTKVRLKDITDLFLDSGASSKSFNIISQGTVTDMINNKPENRRVIFEEAAGVLKYKKRKEDTLRKLDKTNDNLEKVNLLIEELEVQVEPLKIESLKATKYLEYSNSLKQTEISLIAKDLSNITKEQKDLKLEQEKINSKIETMNLSNTKQNTELESLRLEKMNFDESFKSKQENMLNLTKEIANLEAQKQLVSERKKYQVDNQKLQNNIISLKEEELNLNKNITTTENEVNILQEQLDKLNKQKKDLDDDILNLTHKHYSLEAQINTRNKNILELKNKIDIVQNNLDENASIPYPVKQILNNPRFTEIYGTINSVIKVKENELTAINVALGANANVLITENEQIAKQAIEYLKDNNLGRATFFPLNIIKERNVDNETLDKLTTAEGFIDVASNLVEYDLKYTNIIKNQLGNVVVVKDIDSLNNIGKLIDYKYRVISLSGEVLYPGGALTGGSIKNKNNILTLKEELNKLNNQMEEFSFDARNLARNFNELLNNEKLKEEELRNIQSEIINYKEQVSRKNQTLSDLKSQYNQKKQELIGTLNIKDNALDKELELILENYYQKNTEKDLLEQEINNLRTTYEELLEKINTVENNNRTFNTEYNKYVSNLKDIEIKLGKMDVKIDNYLNILNENYSMTYERALEESDLSIDVEEAKTEVSKLKSKIKELGEVSIPSIKEYERVSTRYNFLKTQQDDIYDSINELQGLINSMDEIMIERFNTTYNQINQTFTDIFKELFKGGEAHLILTDPDNLLETGVDIIAEPPGKKLSSIVLMSGGEKTLTAIALLFAILKVKPVPFVVLDEVEAALDEPNVVAFSNYLTHEKSKTQFIVITHKKKTMEQLDRLYGITMQEAGVSKLVSVSLEDN